jgi:acyl-CoA thioester hydrolase
MNESDGQEALTASKAIDIRFSEVDSMEVVWHGNYAKYFEDAREVFGEKYDFGYLRIFREGYYTPLVELNFSFKQSISYGEKAYVKIVYEPCEAAKIIFNYEVYTIKDGQKEIAATGRSIQVFLDSQRQLLWTAPPFYDSWRKRWNVLI